MVASASDKVVIRLRWNEGTTPKDHAVLFQVITLREGRIIAMQDYRRRRPALRAIG